MPLLILSGLPSPLKKALFFSLLSGLIKKYESLLSKRLCASASLQENKSEESVKEAENNVYCIDSVLIVLQNAVGVNAREETAKMRSLIQNNLSKNALVLIYAPLHIKSLRYEITSAAKNMEINTAHIYCAVEYQEGGEITVKEMQDACNVECAVAEVLTGTGKIEGFDVVSRIFEKPRKANKWDIPCFTIETVNANICADAALEKAWEVIQKIVKVRASSKKLVPSVLNTKYFQKLKEIINSVLDEKKKIRNIPLKISKQSEIDFVSSIQMAYPPIEKVKEIYTSFLEKYLN